MKKKLRLGIIISTKRQDVPGQHLFSFDRSDNRKFTSFGSADYHKFTRTGIDISQSCDVDLMCHQHKRLAKVLLMKPLCELLCLRLTIIIIIEEGVEKREGLNRPKFQQLCGL